MNPPQQSHIGQNLTAFKAERHLMAAIAHDINNILTGILGNLELLDRRAKKNDLTILSDYTNGARSAANRGVDLTRRLIAASGRQLLEPVARPSVDALTSIIAMLAEEFSGLQPVTRFTADLWPFYCDISGLESALNGLCKNAVAAVISPASSNITIRAENILLDDTQAAAAEIIAGRYVAIAVTDAGTGMTSEIASNAFKPFFTTKSGGVGTGLGLTAVLGFARQSCGHAFIADHAPGHTTIMLWLPAASES